MSLLNFHDISSTVTSALAWCSLQTLYHCVKNKQTTHTHILAYMHTLTQCGTEGDGIKSSSSFITRVAGHCSVLLQQGYLCDWGNWLLGEMSY